VPQRIETHAQNNLTGIKKGPKLTARCDDWAPPLYRFMMSLFGHAIESIAASARRPGWVRVKLEDGTSIELTESRCADLGLRPSMPLDDGRLAALSRAAAIDAIKDQALKLLSRRSWGTRELRIKLLDRCVHAALVDAVIDELKAAGLLDDESFARELYDRECARGPARQALARAKLQRAGIDPNLIDRVECERQLNPADEARRLVEQRIKRAADTPRARLIPRLARLLASRGFDEDTARHAIECVMGTIDHELDD